MCEPNSNFELWPDVGSCFRPGFKFVVFLHIYNIYILYIYYVHILEIVNSTRQAKFQVWIMTWRGALPKPNTKMWLWGTYVYKVRDVKKVQDLNQWYVVSWQRIVTDMVHLLNPMVCYACDRRICIYLYTYAWASTFHTSGQNSNSSFGLTLFGYDLVVWILYGYTYMILILCIYRERRRERWISW